MLRSPVFGPATLDYGPSAMIGREMAAGTSTNRNAPALNNDQRTRAERCVRRLHESLRDFWRSWPLARRNPSQIARELEVDRTTCQRVSWLTREPFDTEAIVEATPGVRALRGLIDAAERAHSPVPADVLSGFRSAVDEFDELLRAYGGSLSGLKRRLELSRPASEPRTDGEALEPEEALYRAARRVARRDSRATISIGLYDAVGVPAEQMRHVRISGNHAMTADANAVPMVLEAFDALNNARDDGWQRTPTILPEFTSAEWRGVQLRGTPGFASQAVEIARSETPSDLFRYTIFPVPEPTTLDDPIEESWYIMNYPTAALVFDLYLHESIARRCIVSLDIHLWQVSFAHSPHGRWHTRMPQAPAIAQLGRGLHRVDNEHYPRHRAVTEKLFELASADPAHYFGFRCIERFPLWRTGYRFELDFGRQSAPD